MIKTAIKSVLAHKIRLALTVVAIVMGVAFVAGTYVFTDTITARFDHLFADVYAGVDATVKAPEPEFGQDEASLDAALLETVVATDGVAQAAPSVGGIAQIIAADGTPIGGQGPPTLGMSWVDVPALSAFSFKEGNGRAPEAAGEVAIDVGTATAHDLSVGDTVEIQLSTGVETFTIAGLASFGSEDNLAGATISIFELSEAQRLFGLEGRYSQIDVLAQDGVEPEALVTKLQASLPADVDVKTGDQQGQAQMEFYTDGLGFVTTALLAFAAVAVFVGAFIISNTFRIIVAQRTKELALLRALGASSRQVTVMVMVEALIVGVVASAIGIVAGIGFSMLLKAGMTAVGMGMPEGPLTIAPRTVFVGMAVGIVVTLVSALQPARRAAKTPPIAAMRDVASGNPPLLRRAQIGIALFLSGAACLIAGLVVENGASLPLVAVGALLAFLGASVLAPLFARPIVWIIGRPFPGIVGRLARGNTARQPRRTAATASALMVGVALVAFVSIFGASIKASVAETMNHAFPADLSLQSTNYTMGIAPEAVERLASLAEFETVSPLMSGETRVDGEVVNVAAFDPATVEQVYSPDASIPLSSLDGGLLVRTETLAKHGWTVGQELPVEFASGEATTLSVAGTFEDRTFADYLLTSDTLAAHTPSEDAFIVLATLAEGIDLEQGRAAAETVVEDFPNLMVRSASDQIAATQKQIDQMLTLFSGLLGLAVIIAVIGIANTLALTTVERTREIGLLRAVGMSRRQVRSMVRWEAVMTSLFGAVLGIVMGVGLGWTVVLSLADEGLGTFAFPGLQLAIGLAVAGIAGVVAAIGPARKASRMNVLEAISFE